ncbi:hypothetical protein AYO48_03335 [Gaiella sp. SCGC AG-212-M14]|nr:hypothetical protein AYO48_03335 [Gaiella sp. SCGC AG-212-M14]
MVLVATALAGPNRPALAFRRWLAPIFRHHPVAVWAAGIGVFLLVIAVGPRAGNRQLVGLAILAITAAIAIGALRRQTLREFPEDRPRAVAKAPGAT